MVTLFCVSLYLNVICFRIANTTSGWGTANPANQNNAGTQQWNSNANRPPTSNQGPTQDGELTTIK